MKTTIMKSARIAVLFPLAFTANSAFGSSLNVVTTTEDLASIAREVGGEKVSVVSLARGYQDPHFVDAKPSYLLKLRRADLFIEVGKELEIGWAPVLVNNAHNAVILPGAQGFLDASVDIRVLEVPTGQVSRAQGDIHPYGNPHYWLDPENGLIIAETIRQALSGLSPGDAPYFKERQEIFDRHLREAIAGWRKKADSMGLRGLPVVTYHNSWPYFAQAFGLEVAGFVEARPGIPPSPSHTAELERLMKDKKVRLLIVEPYFDAKLPMKIAEDTGARLVVLGPSVGWEKGVNSYFELFEHNLEILSDTLKGGDR
jgi:zinc/manganese transport system substrate-binding protein